MILRTLREVNFFEGKVCAALPEPIEGYISTIMMMENTDTSGELITHQSVGKNKISPNVHLTFGRFDIY